MKSDEIRKRFLDFFEKRGHAIIPSASLVPENDPSVLFISAGMQPLVPYLLGEKHPQGKRLANVQKVLRTVDIDNIGDSTHLTFFEMMGNWSLGDYWKEEAIKGSFELATSEEGFGLDQNRIYITCFEGNKDAPKDEESAQTWEKMGISKDRIYFLGAEDNWWSTGENGPSGPDTEMFYDLTKDRLGEMSKEEFIKANKREDVVEIWNDVFMEYESKGGKVVGKLTQQNVDKGVGLERLATVLQGKDNVYETDLFTSIMAKIKALSDPDSEKDDLEAERIIADHIRSAVFVISDGVVPSNTDQGYILRRLIRRSVRKADFLGMKEGGLLHIAGVVINEYGDFYGSLLEKGEEIKEVIGGEESKFRETLKRGLKEFEKLGKEISGKEAFDLYQSYGFPVELTKEMVEEKGGSVDMGGFKTYMVEHSQASTVASAGKFKGGLAGTGEMETKYHTATHLLLAALNKVLGGYIEQRGSNITEQRLRFDFSHGEKMTDEEKQKVEDLINQKIQEDLPVSWKEMSMDEAKKVGAHGIFEDKYGERVKVYQIGSAEHIFSLEICGGPHVERTGVLGKFKIKKETSSSAGIRRIKAVLQ